MKKTVHFLIITSWMLASINAVAQQRPDPGSPPDFIPEAPPTSKEIVPFPSSIDNRAILIYNPLKNEIILSLHSKSNYGFILQSSTDLINWTDTDLRILARISHTSFGNPAGSQKLCEPAVNFSRLLQG